MDFTLTPLPAFNDNYIWLLDAAGSFAAAVDPGDAAPVEPPRQSAASGSAAVLITHHHPDHMGGAQALAAGTCLSGVTGPPVSA